MASLSLSVGPILLGGMFNAFLAGALVIQCHTYFSNFPNDRLWLKGLVTYLLVMNLANTGFDIALVWHYMVKMFGNYEGVRQSVWLYTIEPLMTVMISTVGQTFYAWRITRLTGWTWLGYIIVASAFVQFCGGIGGSVGISIITDFSMFHRFKVAVIVWLVLSALTDTTITIVLVWYLQSHRTGFPDTDNLINRLIRLTIQSGSITALCAIADLVTFLCLDNNLHMFFQLILCKLYSNTLMSTLNSRTESRTRPPTADRQGSSGPHQDLEARLKSAGLPNVQLPTSRTHVRPTVLRLRANSYPDLSTMFTKSEPAASPPTTSGSSGGM